MELREKIARATFFLGDEPDEKQWAHMQERYRALAYKQADAILAIPEIKAGLNLLQMEIDLGEYDMSGARK